MNNKVIVFVSALLLTGTAFADNVGGCGWGSKLFDGQKGIAPQVLAVTTNGTSGNQTFGITSGTSGCSQDGVVASKWKTAAYMDANLNKLALDASRGKGESLEALASLMGVSAKDSAHFNSTIQNSFAELFPTASVSSNEVAGALKSVLSSDARLAQYAANV